MIYLKSFRIPDKDQEGGYDVYPFGVLPILELSRIDFDDVTIFHGGNGTGKSTLIKVIAAKLGISTETQVGSYSMDRYVELCDEDSFCPYDEYDKLRRDFNTIYDIRRIVRLLTSDEVFHSILSKRKENKRYDMRKEMLKDEWRDAKEYRVRCIDFETGEGLSEFKRVRSVTSKRQHEFIKDVLGDRCAEHSNGESSLLFFTERITPGHLYLLDEPENSLSAVLQLELARMIVQFAQHHDCQFIIATHSPFLLAINGAKIYDLDCVPVETRSWTELESVQIYRSFFQMHERDFQ